MIVPARAADAALSSLIRQVLSQMLFYFHQRVGDGYLEDPEGYDYPSVDAARTAAIIAARHLWAAAIIDGDDLTGESIEVASADGRHLFSVPLADVLPLGRGSGHAAVEAEGQAGVTTSRRAPSFRHRPAG